MAMQKAKTKASITASQSASKSASKLRPAAAVARAVGVGVFIAVAAMGGCTAFGEDPETRNLMATLPVAGSAGSAHSLALLIAEEMTTNTTVPEAERADMLARAQVLGAHALALGSAIELYDPAGKQNPSITLANLKARAQALELDYRIAANEWGIWHVRHGLKKPQDVFQVFDYARAIAGE